MCMCYFFSQHISLFLCSLLTFTRHIFEIFQLISSLNEILGSSALNTEFVFCYNYSTDYCTVNWYFRCSFPCLNY